MAFERIGLGGTLEFNDAGAVRAMGRASDSFRKLSRVSDDAARATDRPRNALGRYTKGAEQAGRATNRLTGFLKRLQGAAVRAGRGIGKIASGTRQLTRAAGVGALAMLPLTLAVGVAANQAAAFEQQMSAVAAVTGATGKDFAALERKAKELGATTSFTGTQSAEALELMGRAGFKTGEIITGVSGIISAAEADGIDLATATGIVTQTLKGMGLEADQTGRVADVLALTSARANTNITKLGQGMSLAVGQAKTMGIKVEQLAALLGKLSDAGLGSTRAGTSLVQMLVKLNKPTTEGAKLIKKWNIQLEDTQGNLLPISKIVAQFKTRIDAMSSATARGKAQVELFGIRGGKAFAALSTAIEGGRDTIAELTNELTNAAGAAKRMAAIRLDNFRGQMTLLKSAAEGFFIEVFGPLLKTFKPTITTITKGLSQVVLALQLLSQPLGENGEMLDANRAKWGELSATAQSIAKGVSGAIGVIQEVWTSLGEAFARARGLIIDVLGPDGLEKVAKIATMVAIFGAALAPVVIALVGIGFVVGAVLVPALGGLGTILSGVAGIISGPLLAVVGALILGFFAIRRENETIMGTLTRVWTTVKRAVIDVWENAVKPFIDGFREGFAEFLPALENTWNALVDAIRLGVGQIGELFGTTLGEVEINWKTVGKVAGFVIGALVTGLTAVVTVIAAIVTGLIFIGKTIIDVILFPFRQVLQAFRDLKAELGIGKPDLMRFAVSEEQAGAATTKLRARREDETVKLLAELDAKLANAAKSAADSAAAQKAAAAAPTPVQANVTIEDKRCVEVDAKLQLDGREIAAATAKHRTEISERAGFKSTPWQRRMAVEAGASPAPSPGGGV